MVTGLPAAGRVVSDPTAVGIIDGGIACDHGTRARQPTGGRVPSGGSIRTGRPPTDPTGVPTDRFSQVPGDPS